MGRRTRAPVHHMEVEGIAVEVHRKTIKNIYLRIDARGAVRLSAPRRMTLAEIRGFAVSRLAWIRLQRARLLARPAPPQWRYENEEQHLVWGEPCRLMVLFADRPASVIRVGDSLFLRVRPGAGVDARRTLLEGWYRGQLSAAVPPLLALWEPRLGVGAGQIRVRAMKTLWGSCNPRTATIRLNTELARRPPESLEYVLVHELVHLLEPSHNQRFVSFMQDCLPDWKRRREALNNGIPQMCGPD